MDDRDYFEFRTLRTRQLMNAMLIFYPVVALMVFFIFFAWPPIRNLMQAKHEIMIAQAKGLNFLPELESKLNALEKRTAALTSENIDNRLIKIEKAIKIGEIKPQEIASLQEIRDDLSKLKTFMFSDPEHMVELRALQKDYLDLKSAAEKMMRKDDILREIDSVRNLFYATLAICGVLVSIFAGAWFIALKKSIRPMEEKPPNKSIEDDKE
jgi:hypothetical protein